MSRACVAIIGAGGQGAVVSDILMRSGFSVCSIWLWSKTEGFSRFDSNLSGPCSSQSDFEHHSWAVAVGDNEARVEIVLAVRNAFLKPTFPNIVDSSASISKSATLGEGTIVHHGANVGPKVQIGNFVILNTLSNVEHHANLGSYSHLAPGAVLLGGSTVGDCCFLGANSVVGPKTIVPNNSIVGALSFVNQNFELEGTFVGVPARRS